MTPPPPLTTCELRARLIKYANAAVGADLISENRLAILTGYSQPHVHHVLNGIRQAAPALADAIARVLRVNILDLYTLGEIRDMVQDSQAEQLARLELVSLTHKQQ